MIYTDILTFAYHCYAMIEARIKKLRFLLDLRQIFDLLLVMLEGDVRKVEKSEKVY